MSGRGAILFRRTTKILPPAANETTMSKETEKIVPVGSDALFGWPDAPGFYWWRGAPSFRWEIMQVLAYGADDDQSRYMAQKVEARQVMRSLQVWKERGPECGEWVKIRQPETVTEQRERKLREHVCNFSRAMDGTCFICGSSSLPNKEL